MAAALTAAGCSSDVYDFDTQGRKAPHHLGVLSHYEAVVWETGDDIILRAPGQVGGTTAKAALDIELAVRDYLNEGGKLLVGGKYALFAQAANGAYYYNPFTAAGVHHAERVPVPAGAERLPAVLAGRPHLHRRRRHRRRTAAPYPLTGIADPFTGFTGTLNAAGSAANQDHTASFLPTSSFLPPAQFPWFGPARRRSTGTARAPRRSTRSPATGISTVARPTCRTSG